MADGDGGRTRTWAPGCAAVLDCLVRPGGPALSAEGRLLYLALYSHMGGDGRCWPSITSLAAGTGLSRRTVMRRIRDLERAGLLGATVRHGTVTQYLLRPPWAPVSESHPCQRVTSATESPVPQSHPTGDTQSPALVTVSHTEVTHRSNPSKKPNVNVNGDYADDFESWWAEYPRHVNRAAALKAYRARRRAGVSAEDLMAANRHHATWHDERGTETEYIPHGATFLHGRVNEWLHGPPEDIPPPKSGRTTSDAQGGGQHDGVRGKYADLG